jgi:hypothetical protein
MQTACRLAGFLALDTRLAFIEFINIPDGRLYDFFTA